MSLLPNARQTFFFKDDVTLEERCYDGDVFKTKCHGFGKLTNMTTNAVIFEGTWSEDMPISGRARYNFDPFGVYIGPMINSKFEGEDCVVLLNNGWRYRGAMSNNMAHGIGVLYSVDGSKLYEGDFKNGTKHGSGHEWHVNGGWYTGQFQCDQRHGSGLYKFPNGATYDGQWVRGKMEGHGELKREDGSVYKGLFKKNCLSYTSTGYETT